MRVNNAARGVVIALGCIGTLLFIFGLWATLRGTIVALPGLGIVVGGGVILMAGVLIIAVALAVNYLLISRDEF